MIADDFFHAIPLAIIYLFTVFFVLASLAVGLLLGHHYMRTRRPEKEPSIGSAVTATLGLLAFMLAFTFNMTANRYSDRKALLLNEVNAIHTAYLHADFLQSEAARKAQALLVQYAELREWNPTKVKVTPEGLAKSVAIQNLLWDLVGQHIAAGYTPGYLRQFVEPLTAIVNSHNSRIVVGLEYRIPGPIWIALYFLTGLAMLAIGFQFGISRVGSVQVAIPLSLTFATVILLIADLDRATEGVIILDQRPMSEMSLILHQLEIRRR